MEGIDTIVQPDNENCCPTCGQYDPARAFENTAKRLSGLLDKMLDLVKEDDH